MVQDFLHAQCQRLAGLEKLLGGVWGLNPDLRTEAEASFLGLLRKEFWHFRCIVPLK